MISPDSFAVYAQRRPAILRTAPSRWLADPDGVPDTYAEFLDRASGLLAHQPPASARIERHRRSDS